MEKAHALDEVINQSENKTGTEKMSKRIIAAGLNAYLGGKECPTRAITSRRLQKRPE